MRARLAFAIEGGGRHRLIRPLGKRRQSQLLCREVYVDQIRAENIRADQAVLVSDGGAIADRNHAVCKLQFSDLNVIGYGQVTTLQALIANSGKTDVGDACQTRLLGALASNENSARAGIQQ